MNTEIRAASRGLHLPAWDGQSCLTAATLESLLEVNEQVLELVSAQCRAVATQSLLTRDVSGLLLTLDAASTRRAASCGVLLVDVGFGDAGLWSDALVGAVNDRHPPRAPFFTVDGTVGAMRQVMTHAWHLARSEPTAARLLLGLSAANLSVLGGCTLNRLTRLAESRSEWLRPRWENRPRLWCDLLRTAGDGASGALEGMRVRCLQLLAADARQG